MEGEIGSYNDHYERRRCLEILGLQSGATKDDIKRAYKHCALRYHPDKNSDANSTLHFQEINAAYQYLTEGSKGIHDAMRRTDVEDELFLFVIRSMFPWLFSKHKNFGTPNPSSDFTFTSSHHTHQDSSSQRDWRHYYDEDASDDDEDSTGSQHGGASAASQHYQKASFTHSTDQHGQFFREHGKSKSAKKRNRKAKRKEKQAKDGARAAENTQNGATNSETQTNSNQYSKPVGAERRSSSRETGESSSSSPRQEESSSFNIKPETEGATGGSKQEPIGPKKKSKKQLLSEQKQREKDLLQLRQELEQKEQENKEKMERKRRAQEEKRRKEQEEMEAEERRRDEERRKKAEERREREAENTRMQRLMEQFDEGLFVDDKGGFKSGEGTLASGIQQDGLNNLGGNTDAASPRGQSQTVDQINGFNAQDMIELQNAQLDLSRPPPTPKAASSHHQFGQMPPADFGHMAHGSREAAFTSPPPQNRMFNGHQQGPMVFNANGFPVGMMPPAYEQETQQGHLTTSPPPQFNHHQQQSPPLLGTPPPGAIPVLHNGMPVFHNGIPVFHNGIPVPHSGMHAPPRGVEIFEHGVHMPQQNRNQGAQQGFPASHNSPTWVYFPNHRQTAPPPHLLQALPGVPRGVRGRGRRGGTHMYGGLAPGASNQPQQQHRHPPGFPQQPQGMAYMS